MNNTGIMNTQEKKGKSLSRISDLFDEVSSPSMDYKIRKNRI